MAKGPVAFVTGAASGIGRAVSLRLCAEGYSLCCFDLDDKGAAATAGEVAALGHLAASFALDVSSGAFVEGAFEQAREELGPPSVLVHSAGVMDIAPALELSEARWRRVVDTNLTGTFLCDKTAAAEMRRAGRGGRIVNVASVHSISPGIGLAHYDASKGGVLMLTRNLALELAPYAITVNAVGPGLIVHTRLAGDDNEDYLDEVVPEIPLGRPGEPEDVAGAVAFLCSPDASYVTGTMLVVDGGMLLTART